MEFFRRVPKNILYYECLKSTLFYILISTRGSVSGQQRLVQVIMGRLADVMGALRFRFRSAFGRKFGMVYSDKVALANANFLRIAISHIMRIRRNPIRTYMDIQRTGRWTPTRPTSIALSTYHIRHG